VVDLRSRAGWDGWHYPDALHLPFDQALGSWSRFPADRVYVLYCEVGLKSAYLAERMQASGFQAYHFSRGLKGISSWARRAGVVTPALEDA
jgi:thiamine biosynthesis protein ThiI